MRTVWKMILLLSASSLLLLATACQQTRETQYLMEVTVEVTRVVVVTATPDAPEVAQIVPTATPAAETDDDESSAVETVEPVETPDPLPTPVVESIIVAEQAFENGRMFYLQPLDQIWVLVSDDPNGQTGTWAFHEDEWEEGMPESDPELEAPEGLVQPVRGFGRLWREDDSIREALGWALDDEYGHWTRYVYTFGGQIDDDGEYVPGPGQHALDSREGFTLVLDEATATWERFIGAGSNDD